MLESGRKVSSSDYFLWKVETLRVLIDPKFDVDVCCLLFPFYCVYIGKNIIVIHNCRHRSCHQSENKSINIEWLSSQLHDMTAWSATYVKSTFGRTNHTWSACI